MNRFFVFAISCFICLVFNSLHAKVLVMTHCYNKPEYIAWQHNTFKKFLKDEYEFVVFNDAPNEQMSTQVKDVCASFGITCIEVPQIIHDYRAPYLPGSRNPLGDPSAECADTIQYMLDKVGFDHPGCVALVDSDMFLIRDLNIEETMQDYGIAGHIQFRDGNSGRINYLLPNLIIFNMAKLDDKTTLNFNLGVIDGVNVDTGGFTHFYLDAHPNLKWLMTDCLTAPFEPENSNLGPQVITNFQAHPKFYELMTEMKYDFEFYYNYTFLHFRAGSNWYKMEESKRQKKSSVFFEALRDILN